MVTNLTYVFDAYCGWCYGLAEALHEFADTNNVQVDVISGGLFSGNNAAPISAFPHMPAANQRITQLTGAQFGPAYQKILAAGQMWLDSDDASVGLVALKLASGGAQLGMARALQDAFYQDGLSLSDLETYRHIAAKEQLDIEQVLALLEDPGTAQIAAAERAHARNLGVHSYPTLLAHTSTGLSRVGSAVSSAAHLQSAVEQLAG